MNKNFNHILHKALEKERELTTNHGQFTEQEQDHISKIYQNYYCTGIDEIAEEDETAKSIFEKVGLIDETN